MIEWRIKVMRQITCLLLISTVLLWIILLDRRGDGSSSRLAASSKVALRSLTHVPKHPIIYAFHQEGRIQDQDNDNKQNDEEMQAWLDAWKTAGWDARILTLNHALKHPNFDVYDRAIGEVMPYGHRAEKMGYYRFLAMNVVGGGWLTDFSVWPLWPVSVLDQRILQESAFTVHCGKPKRPNNCLMSASASEWNRMTTELVSSMERHYQAVYHHTSIEGYENNNNGGRSTWSDVYALEEIASFANPKGRPLVKREFHVLGTPAALQMRSLPSFVYRQCQDVTDKLAVRFAKLPHLPESETIDLHYKRLWIQQFRRDCVRGSALPGLGISSWHSYQQQKQEKKKQQQLIKVEEQT